MTKLQKWEYIQKSLERHFFPNKNIKPVRRSWPLYSLPVRNVDMILRHVRPSCFYGYKSHMLSHWLPDDTEESWHQPWTVHPWASYWVKFKTMQLVFWLLAAKYILTLTGNKSGFSSSIHFVPKWLVVHLAQSYVSQFGKQRFSHLHSYPMLCYHLTFLKGQ